MDQAKHSPSPWLSLAVAIFAIVVAIVWAYIQMRHWQEPGINAMALAGNIAFTLLMLALVITALIINLRDSRRAKAIIAQIVTIKDESETQIGHYKRQADQEKEKAAQATRERSEAQSRAFNAEQQLGGCKYLVEQQISAIHRLRGELSEHIKLFGEATPEKTPDGLRRYVSRLAGSLLSILVEIGEGLENPIREYGQALFEDHPSDPRVTTRVSEWKIVNRLKDAYLCARDIGVLPECISWSTSIADVQDVRNRIGDLGVLAEALMRRFPDLPASTTPEVL